MTTNRAAWTVSLAALAASLPFTFYGDLKEPVEALAKAMGWKIVAEA